MVGVGGIVLNEKDELLVIKEKYATAQHWKLPGGNSQPVITGVEQV